MAAAIVASWKSIPAQIRRATRGLTRADLDRRGGSEEWSIREYAHHLIEANLVACTIVIAALGRRGSTYDWSWLIPDESWMRNIQYDRAPLAPALAMLDAMSRHVAGLIERSPRSLRRHVFLKGTSGRRKRTTVADVLAAEVDHAKHHLADIDGLRSPRS